QADPQRPGEYGPPGLVRLWRIKQGTLVLEPLTPRFRDHVQRWQGRIEVLLRRQKLPVETERYTIKSATADECTILSQQTAAPVSYLEHEFTRVPESNPE